LATRVQTAVGNHHQNFAGKKMEPIARDGVEEFGVPSR
jgi:hypothetical protein